VERAAVARVNVVAQESLGDAPGRRTLLAEARGLVFAYPGGVRALEGVDVRLWAGELVVVIGPNGSGKSTLLKTLGGLLRPDAGRVELDGRPIGEFAPRERAARIAIVPQFLPALPEVSVGTFVESGRYAHVDRRGLAGAILGAGVGVRDRPAVESALQACDVAQFKERAMTELSGGQRQRVLVARAIAQEASVLLVDEPTNALDPEHQIAVFDLLALLRGGGRAVLVVTHDLNLAGQYASRLVLLDQGRVVADGDPPSVLTRAVLEPVYGRHLFFGAWPEGSAQRGPFVLPCRAP
jgi:iron complex transport system ATP-binding protein